MSWHDLLGFILILAAAAAIPGPDVAAIIGSGLNGGLPSAFRLVLGLILGHAVWMTAAVTGLAALAQALGAAFIVIKLGAVAYLLYLAWKLWTAPVAAGLQADAPFPGQAEPVSSPDSSFRSAIRKRWCSSVPSSRAFCPWSICRWATSRCSSWPVR